MRIEYSDVSCGIYQVSEIGDAPDVNDLIEANKEFGEYEGTNVLRAGYVLIASLTTKQKAAIKFLKREGFAQVDRAKKNPNSGNKIALWVKRLSRKDAARYKKLVEADGDGE